MAMRTLIFSIPLLLISSQCFSGSTLDAAIGGGIGGATGAAIGNELGGREGAIVGGAIGGATGAAIATNDDKHDKSSASNNYSAPGSNHNKSSFCPPGQRKKGRC
jgi:hypothetical protein